MGSPRSSEDSSLLITSAQNPRVKEAAKLRDRRQRDKQNRIIIDGIREIKHALASGIEVVEAFVCESLCTSSECQQTLSDLRQSGSRLLFVTEPVFEKLAYGERSAGIVAVANRPHTTLSDLKLPNAAMVAVIEGIEKPGNFGAILRSADGAGIAAVIAVDGRTDLYNPNCIRASLGTVFTRPVCEATSAEARDWLKANGFRLFAARVDGAVNYANANFQGNVALLLGSEAAGLSPAWRDDEIQSVQLPMHGTADSLNVSATAAVLFYESLRQRTS